jgi:hypothetical protein
MRTGQELPGSQTAGHLRRCGPAGRRVAIGDRELTASMAAVAGAIEITVHGWDILWRAARPGRSRHRLSQAPAQPGAAIPPNPAGLYQQAAERAA